MSEFGKSAYSSEDSLDKKYKQPQTLRGFGEKAEKRFESKKPSELKKNHEEKQVFTQKWQSFKPNDENFKGKSIEKEVELKTLKDVNEELIKKISDLNEILEKRDKDLNKILFEKNQLAKAENDLRKALFESETLEKDLKKDLKLLRISNEKLENDKKDLQKLLSEQRHSFEMLQRELLTKTEELQSLRTSKDFEFESPKSPGLSFDPRKFDFQRLRIPEKLSPTSPETAEYLTERHEMSFKATCLEAMKIVGISEIKDFYPRLLHLRQYHSKYKKAKQIVDRISDMMVQCSPEGTFKQSPSTRQIWRWITRLLEEYMRLKQSLAGDLLYKLCDLLEVQHLEDILDSVLVLVKRKNN
jgi:hypothetical protein